jgi:uncharacterized protein
MMHIWRAAREGNLAGVMRVVESKPSMINAKDTSPSRMTPLMWACRWTSEATPWTEEAGRRYLELLRWLIDKGAVIDDKNKQECTALFLASASGRVPLVMLLLERGADPMIANPQKYTALMTASAKGFAEVVRCLLGHHAVLVNINHQDVSGKTALWVACDYGRGEVARVLLEAGADPTVAKTDGTIPLDIARQPHPDPATREGRRECEALLLMRGILGPFGFKEYVLRAMTPPAADGPERAEVREAARMMRVDMMMHLRMAVHPCSSSPCPCLRVLCVWFSGGGGR